MSTEPHHKPVVRLINDISVQFHREPVPVAAEAVATHIRQFWDPRMRAQLLALDPTDEDELDERALAAVAILRASASPRSSV